MPSYNENYYSRYPRRFMEEDLSTYNDIGRNRQSDFSTRYSPVNRPESRYAYEQDRDWQSRRGRNSRESDDRSWWDRAGDEVLTWFGDDYAERRRRHDQIHRGKGPKNYVRADDRIREDINDRLTDEWNIDASDIEVTVSNGEVTLSGFVTDRFQKRRAEDIAEHVSGVKHVENRIRLNTLPPDERRSQVWT
jgi:osmotically-inducible protein OsmY